jgi:hypothetical protein
VDLNFGAGLNVPPILADFMYHCGERPVMQTVYEIDVLMTEPFNVMDMFELTSAHAHVNAYKYATGGSWFTAGPVTVSCCIHHDVPVYPYTLAASSSLYSFLVSAPHP